MVQWSRGQKFMLTQKGVVAESTYRSCVEAARKNDGRTSFNDMLDAWAKPLKLSTDDGAYLSELKAGAISLSTIITAFDGCGRTPDETKAALERLVAAGLIASSDGM